jgi:putative ABC transport system permease protein
LTLVAVALAISAVVALVGVSTGFKRSFLEFYEESNTDLLVVRTGSARRLTSTMEESLGDKIATVPGVTDVIPTLIDVVSFPDEGLYVVPVSGLEPQTEVFERLQVVSGRKLRQDDGKAVMLGITLADSLGKSTGDRLEIVEDEEFEIIGVYDSLNVFENGSMIVSIDQLQRLMGRENQVPGFCIMTDASTDDQRLLGIAHQIEDLETGISARSTREHVESLTEIQLAVAMAWLTSTVAIMIGTAGMLNTMFMSIHERTLEIGLLRAVGWSRLRVIGMILSEAVLLSIVGALVGVGTALVVVRLLTKMPAANGLIEGEISAAVVGQGLLIAVLVGFVGGLLPAISASRLSPSEALRR